MKKRILILATAFMLLCSACGSKYAETASANSASYDSSGFYAQSTDTWAEDYDLMTDADDFNSMPIESKESADYGMTDNLAMQYDLGSKIIYRSNANIQTLTFDASVKQIEELTAHFQGFIEASSVTGQDYYASKSRQHYRTANYTLRIPTESFVGMQTALSEIGNVTYLNTNTDNVTTAYYDKESRLTTYRTEEERLLVMLEKCETVEDMLRIEDHLSEVRYQIESLTTSLRHYDQLIAYSTLEIMLTEVAELTEQTPVVRSYWQQIKDGFSDSLRSVGRFFKDLFRVLLSSIPYLIPILLVLAVLVLLLRKLHRSRRAKKLLKQIEKQTESETPPEHPES